MSSHTATWMTTSPMTATQRPGDLVATSWRDGEEIAGCVSIPLASGEPLWLCGAVHLPPRWLSNGARALREIAALLDPENIGPAWTLGPAVLPVGASEVWREVQGWEELLGTAGSAAGSVVGDPWGGAAGQAFGEALGGGLDDHERMGAAFERDRQNAVRSGEIYARRYRNASPDELLDWMSEAITDVHQGRPSRPLFGAGGVVTERRTGRQSREEYESRELPRDAAARVLGGLVSVLGQGAGGGGGLGGLAGGAGALGALAGPLSALLGGGQGAGGLGALLGALGGGQGGAGGLGALLGALGGGQGGAGGAGTTDIASILRLIGGAATAATSGATPAASSRASTLPASVAARRSQSATQSASSPAASLARSLSGGGDASSGDVLRAIDRALRGVTGLA